MSSYAQQWEVSDYEEESDFEDEFADYEEESDYEEEEEVDSELGSATENELAGQLLQVANEEELDQFLGSVFRSAVRGVGNFARSGAGRALGGILKNVAKKALPVVGGALGSWVAPGIGTAIGSRLGSAAAGLFEIDSETMSDQEVDFEVARRIVRLSAGAAKQAARAPRGAPARKVAQAAVTTAARKHAPGLLRLIQVGAPGPSRPGGVSAPPKRPRPNRPPVVVVDPISRALNVWAAGAAQEGGPSGRATSGQWYRRGRKIVVVGA
ncbi:hypothetical protein [Longispora urticae]